MTDSTSWKRAQDYDVAYYMKCLDRHLQSFCVPTNVLYCSNCFCKLSEHRMVLDNFLCNILKCIIDAEQAAIPRKTCKTKRKPYWNEVAAPLKEKALFWHSLWVTMVNLTTAV